MFDEECGDYDEGVSGDTEFCHEHNDFCGEPCSEKNSGRGSAMKNIKVVEIILRAVSALIAAAMGIVKFINYIDKLQASGA